MAGTTTNNAFPYPSNADAPNIAGDFAALANAVDAKLGMRGKSVIATEQSPSTTSFATLSTPDQVAGIIVPADALVYVSFEALWRATSTGTTTHGEAALYIGSNQFKTPVPQAVPAAQAAPLNSTGSATSTGDSAVYTVPHDRRFSALQGGGLYSEDAAVSSATDTTNVTTGQAKRGGVLEINNLAAGTYTFSVRWRAIDIAVSTVFAKSRVLRVLVLPF